MIPGDTCGNIIDHVCDTCGNIIDYVILDIIYASRRQYLELQRFLRCCTNVHVSLIVAEVHKL